jgi:ferredoxin-NADP reductase
MTDESVDILAAVPWQGATVVEIVVRTPRIKSFFIQLSRPFDFHAGQHVDLRLSAPDGYRAMRSYSIGSSPKDGSRIELAIERLEDGEVSSFFHEVVAVGDEIELRGPLGGHFVWTPMDRGRLLLIGGGSGVVPLMAMIRHRSTAATDIPMLLLLSARRWEDVLFRDELIELHRLQNGFVLVLTLTREAPHRDLDYGRRVDAAMISDALARLPSAPTRVFVCGSNRFANEAADNAISAGVPSAIIRTERYGE